MSSQPQLACAGDADALLGIATRRRDAVHPIQDLEALGVGQSTEDHVPTVQLRVLSVTSDRQTRVSYDLALELKA